MAAIGSEGGRLDLKCRPGTRLGIFELTFLQDDGNPLDLEGYVVNAQCATRTAPPVAKTIVVQVMPQGAIETRGKVRIHMADEVTATLPKPLSLSHPPKEAADWGLEIVEPGTGEKVAEIYGVIRTEGVPVAP